MLKKKQKENGKAQQSSTRQSAAGKKKKAKKESLSRVTAPAVNTRSKSRLLADAEVFECRDSARGL